MSTEAEIVDLAGGRSVIDVRGSDFDSVLLVGGHPVVLAWSDCKGSIEQYMARAGTADCEDQLRALRFVLEGNFDADAPIGPQIFPFLQLFVPARYRLSHRPTCADCQLVGFDTSWQRSREHDHFYPFGHTLVFTQAVDSLSRDRVAYYLNRIRGGHRPIALTATVEGGCCEYVLDGHHKLRAYQAADVHPTFISACRLDAPRLAPDSFARYIGGGHPLARHYRKVKRKYGA